MKRTDDSRVRQGNADQNWAVLRHMALNLLKQEKSAKGGIQAERFQAAWNDDYLVGPFWVTCDYPGPGVKIVA